MLEISVLSDIADGRAIIKCLQSIKANNLLFMKIKVKNLNFNSIHISSQMTAFKNLLINKYLLIFIVIKSCSD